MSTRHPFFRRLFSGLIAYRVVVVLLFGLAIMAGMVSSPFEGGASFLPRDSEAASPRILWWLGGRWKGKSLSRS